MSVYYEQKKVLLSCYNNVEFLEEQVHCHRELEIIICIDGSFEAYVNSRHYVVTSGNMLVVFPNQIHSYINTVRGKYTVIIFSANYIPEIKSYVFENIPENNIFQYNNSNKLDAIIVSLTSPIQNSNKFFSTTLIGYLNLLMAELLTSANFKPSIATDETLLTKILDFCAQNFNNKISLESLSEALYISPVKISTFLNNQLNISLPQLINSMRISTACSLLKNSNLTMTEISNEVGFGSLRSFNRSFLEITQKTPSEFRNSIKNDEKSS